MGSFIRKASYIGSVVVVRLNYCRGGKEGFVQSCEVHRELG